MVRKRAESLRSVMPAEPDIKLGVGHRCWFLADPITTVRWGATLVYFGGNVVVLVVKFHLLRTAEKPHPNIHILTFFFEAIQCGH